MQTGVQIPFAFLLGHSFTARFGEIDGFQRGVYVTTLVASALTALLLVAHASAVLPERGASANSSRSGTSSPWPAWSAWRLCCALVEVGAPRPVLGTSVGR